MGVEGGIRRAGTILAETGDRALRGVGIIFMIGIAALSAFVAAALPFYIFAQATGRPPAWVYDKAVVFGGLYLAYILGGGRAQRAFRNAFADPRATEPRLD